MSNSLATKQIKQKFTANRMLDLKILRLNFTTISQRILIMNSIPFKNTFTFNLVRTPTYRNRTFSNTDEGGIAGIISNISTTNRETTASDS